MRRLTVPLTVALIAAVVPLGAIAAHAAETSCQDLTPTIRGTAGADTLTGTSGDDVIHGGDGDDDIRGRGGDDCIIGGEGRDDLYGGNGADDIFGGSGHDDLYGELGHDSLYGGIHRDRLVGAEGNDQLMGEAGQDTLNGGVGDDVIDGGSASTGPTDVLMQQCEFAVAAHIPYESDCPVGSEQLGVDVNFSAGTSSSPYLGDDVIRRVEGVFTDHGSDRVRGQMSTRFINTGYRGNDIVYSGPGQAGVAPPAMSCYHAGGGVCKQITTGNGDDQVTVGENAHAMVSTWNGDDIVLGGSGRSTFATGNGNDVLRGGGGRDWLLGDDGNDRLYGDGGRDHIEDGYGNDVVFGGADDDMVWANAGDDVYRGGDGPDWIGFYDTNGRQGLGGPDLEGQVVVDLAAGTAVSKYSNDTLGGFLSVEGTGYNDVLRGDDGPNRLYGGIYGNDTVVGRGGNDMLWGNADTDTINGGNGDDQCSGESVSQCETRQEDNSHFTWWDDECPMSSWWPDDDPSGTPPAPCD